MNAPVLLAQLQGTTTQSNSPPRHIKLEKPPGGATITVNLQGLNQLDFSDIASEKLTFVRVGDKLIVLFDNQSTITIDPVFSSDGHPLNNITFEMAPDHMLTGDQFASDFPISTDQSILPAAGAGSGPTAGAHFSDPTVDPLSIGNPLPLLGAENNGTTFGAFLETPANTTPVVSAIPLVILNEDGLPGGNPGGPGDVGTLATTFTGSINVNFGTAQTGSSLSFAATQHTFDNITSGGEAIHFTITTVGGEPTLIAYVGADPTIVANEVLTVTLNSATDTFSVTLMRPLDDPIHGTEDNLLLNIGVVATNGIGQSATTSIPIEVNDDSPVINAANETHSTITDPVQFTHSTATGSLGISFGADNFNNDPNGGDTGQNGDRAVFFTNATVTTTGDNHGVVTSFTGLTSDNQAVHYVLLDNDTVLVGYTGNTAPTSLPGSSGDGPSEVSPNIVFVVSLSDVSNTGSYTVTQYQPLDHVSGGTKFDSIDLTFNFTATDSDGDPVSGQVTMTVDDTVPTLTGATTTQTVGEDGLPNGNHVNGEVQTLTVTTSLDVNWGADSETVQPGSSFGRTLSFLAGDDTTAIAGSTTPVTSLAMTIFGEQGTSLSSEGTALVYVISSNGNGGETLTATAGAGGPTIFTLSLDPTATNGAYTFTLDGPLDHAVGSDTISLLFTVQATDADGDSINQTFAVNVQDDMPVITGPIADATVGEDGLHDGSGAAGLITTTTVTNSLNIGWGADNNNNNTPGATNDRSVVFDSSTVSTLQGMHLTSNGQALSYAISTDPVTGQETLTATAGSDHHTVFTVALSDASNGSYTFTLSDNLDDPAGHGANNIEFTFNVVATDDDGDSVNQTFNVLVQDDLPIAGVGTGESVKEANLFDGSSPDFHDLTVSGSLNVAWGADQNDSGNIANRSVSFQHATASADVQVTDGSGNAVNHLTSNGATVQYGIFNGVLVGYTNNDPFHHQVFTVSLNDDGSGSYTFTLLNNLDHPAGNGNNTLLLTFDYTATDSDGDPSSNTFTVTVVDDVPTAHVGDSTLINEANLPDGNAPLFFGLPVFPQVSGDLNITWGADNGSARSVSFENGNAALDVAVTDSHGNAITGLTSDGNTVNYAFLNGVLVGYTGNNPHFNQVFTVSLNDNGDGSYTFTLLGNLDHPAGQGTNLLNFTFDYTATDSDGDTSSSVFTVSVKDSVPLAFNVGLQTVGEEGLADANHHVFGELQNASTNNVSLNIAWGADDGSARTVAFSTNTVNSLLALHLTSNGEALSYTVSPDGTLLTATAGSDSHTVFTLQLTNAANGTYDFTLVDNIDHQNGNGENFTNLTFNVVATDSDGDPVNQSFTVGIQDDVPILVGNVTNGTVSEDGLSSGNNIVNANHTITLTNEALNVSWGADNGTEPGDPNGRTLAFNVNNSHGTITPVDSSGHALNLTSDGVALQYVLINLANGGQEIDAYRGSSHTTANLIFTVSLDPTATNGAYSFTLSGNLDDFSSHGTPTSSINLNFGVTATDSDGDTVQTNFSVNVLDDVPTVGTAVAAETVSEGGLTGGNSPGAATSAGTTNAPEALNINWGADNGTQPSDANGRSLSFLAGNGTTVLNGGHSLVSSLAMSITGEHGSALSSGGVALVYTITANSDGGETLTAFKGTTSGPEIFTLTLDPTQTHGGYVFNLLGTLDDASNSNSIGLTFTVQAADSDGDTINTSFTVNVTDDAPTVTGTVTAETVSEGGLTGGNSPGAATSAGTTNTPEALNINWGADSATHPGDTNGRTLSFLAGNGTTPIAGGSGAVSSLALAITGEHGTALTSGGVALVYTVASNSNGGETLTAHLGTTSGAAVFTLTLDPTQTHGGYVFNLLGTLDDASNSNSIGLTFTVQAADADGDTVNTSFTVNVADDAPTVTGTVTAETVSEGGLTGGNSPGAATSAGTTGTPEALNINWGADSATHPTDANGRTLSFLASNGTTAIAGGTSPVASLDLAITGEQGTALSSGGVALVYTVTANTNGGETLTATAGTNGPTIFTLTLDPTQTHGGYVFNLLGPLDDASSPTNSNSIGLTFTVQAADADGDTVNTSFVVNVTDDKPVVTGTVTAQTVGEEGLSFGNHGLAGESQTATTNAVSLNIAWGADSNNTGSTDNRSVTFATNTVSALNGMNLTSHGQALSYLITTDSNGEQLLTASAGGHTVFTVQLSDLNNGSYNFTLMAELDHPAGQGENFVNLSFGVVATDADGDSVTQSFTVNVQDDIPTDVTPAATTVLEDTLVTSTTASVTESLGVSFGADGPAAPGTPASSGTLHTFNFNELTNPAQQTITEGTFSIHTNQGTVSSGGNGEIFGTQINITNGGAPFVLSSVDLGLFGVGTQKVELIGTDIHGNTITVTVTLPDTVGLGATLTDHFNAAGTALAGVELTSLQIDRDPGFSGSVVIDNLSVVSGMAAAVPGPVAFTDLTTAINNISAVDNLGHTVNLANLTSGGQTLHYALLDSATLVAYTGNTAPTAINGSNVVFSVVLSEDSSHPNGTYTFTLDKPLDDLNPAPTSAVNFTFNFTATDFDGDTTHNHFTVNVADDVPTVTGNVAGETVSEGGLTGGNSSGAATTIGTLVAPEALNINWGADNETHPSDANGRTLSFMAGNGTTAIAGGSSLVTSLDMTITGEQGTALTSGGVALVYTVTANANGGETLTAFAGTVNGPEIFTLTLDPTQTHGGYVFNLLGTLDDASNSNSIGLTFTVQAADADGDTVNTSFTVNVTDDAPTVTGTVTAQTVGEEGLSFGNHGLAGEAQNASTGPISLNISWGADSNNSGTTDNRSVAFATNTVSALNALDLTSHGQALSYAITTDSNGEQLLTASAGGHTVFTVQLSDLSNGSYNFTLMAELDHPTGQGENFINLSFGVVATDADGDSVTQSFAVNVQDDIPVDVTPAATTVLEHALVSQPSVADAVTSSLGINFGADGPAPAGNSVGTGTTHTYTFNELSAGHNTAVHEDTFTFATDQGVVNTGGNGEIYGSQITITNGGAPFVLSSIDLGIFVPGDGSQSENIKLIGTDINGHKITDVVQIHNSTNVGDTLTYTYLAGTKFDGVQLTSLQIASPSNNFNGDVIIDNFTVVTGGAPATPGPVAFADLQTAINNISAVDSAGHTVDLTHLTSGGEAVHYALLDSATLVAYTGNTAPTSISASDVVFSVSLSQDLVNNPHGAYTFTLDKPLDDLNPTPTSAVNFTFDFTATDFDGDTAAGNFTVNVQDDVPTVGTVAASEVLEATLVTSPSTPDSVSGSLDIGFGADGPAAPGIPANPGTPETFNFNGLANGALSTAQGTFGNFVFTANQGVANGTLEGTLITLKDSATPFTLTSVDLGLAGHSSGSSFDNVTLIGLDSHGNQIASVTVNIGSLLANPGDPLTYTFDAAGTAFAGLQISTLEVMPAEHTSNLNASAFIDNVVVATGAAPAVPGPVAFSDLATAINNISIVDDHGNAVSAATLTSHGDTVHYELLDTATLVAYTGSAPTSINASNVVFSVVLSQDPVNNPDGGYTFTLDKPLDDLPASVTDLKFTFGFTATDFDGDTAAGKFTVDVHDDVPTLVAQTPVSIVDGNFLGGAGDFPTSGSWSQPLGAIDNKGFIEGWTYTASPVGGATQVELERVDSGYAGSFSTDGSPMVDLEASPGNIQVSQTVSGLTAGEQVLVSFEIGEANFGNAKLDVLWDGNVVGTYNPQNGLMQVETIAVTGNGSGTDTLTFEEIGVSGDNTGTFLTDVSAQQVAGTVYEAGLNDFVTSTVPVPGQTFTQTITTHIVGTEAGAANAPTTASGTLAPLVHFGADGPAMNGAANDGFQLTLQNNQAATTFVTGLGLTSLGSSVDAATINGNTLTASAADGHEVFTLTVNGDGTWTFNLIAPLNDPHLGADSITLDFSSLVKAVDFDGDTVNLAAGTFNVAVVDDVPVDTGTPVTGTVSETGLPGVQFAAESLDIAYGADGEQGHLAFASNTISQLNGLNLTSNGVGLTYEIQTTSGGEQQIVAFRPDQGDSNPVFEVTLNSPVNPEYIFTLFQPLDHNGTLPLNFSVVATDGDGDTVNQSFTVNIQDSVPAIGVSVVGDVSEDGPKTLTDAPLNISFGTDNGTFPGSHLGLAFTDGAVAATDPNGNAVALTSYGQAISIGFINGELIGYTGTTEPTSLTDGHIVFTATLNAATDSYDFTLNQPLDHPAPVGTNDSMNLTFDITATDADGSTATGHFTVNVDAAGTIGSIDYNNETTGVFVNLSDNSATDPSDGQTVAGHTSTDLASGGGHVIGIDQLGSIADASGGSANDIFVPGSSNATIHGGGGIDTAMYTATALTTGSFSYDSTTQSWVVTTTNEGTDHLQGVEVVTDNSGHRFLLVGGGSEYTTIQSAIDAAKPGDTILIAPGTYTETATALGTTGGLYINTAGLTLQGYSSLDGTAITTAAQAAADGPTVISGAQNDFGANFLIGTGGTGVTIEGLHLAAGPQTDNKLIEITADGVTIKNDFVDTNYNGHDTGAATIYIDNQGTAINSYLIDHNILNEGIYVASGVGTPGTISTTQIISNNEFTGSFDPVTGDGRYDMIAVQGQLPGVAWQPDSAQVPTIEGNTRDNNESPFIFRMSEQNPALMPNAAQVAAIVAANTDANTSYAYVLNPDGTIHTFDHSYQPGDAPYQQLLVANSIDTLDAGFVAGNEIFGDLRPTMDSGDTVIVQSVGHTVSDIVVDNLFIDATATSTDLTLTLDSAFSVQKITLDDYAPGQGANVNVTGNDLGDTIIGNSGDNHLTGGAGNDIIVGGFGADTISGLGGNDQIDGGQNLVVNGGFNAPEDIVGSASPLATIAGWTISGGTVDVVATNGSLHAVFPGGINMIDTKGVSDGTISQTFNTVVGDTYTVTFLLGTNPDILTNTAYNSAGVTVSATGNASQDFIHAIESGTTWANIEPTLADETYTFTATSTQTTISFAADPQAGNFAYGALIGQVYVEDTSPTAQHDGNNVITDGDGNDVIQGGGGNDTITVGNGNDLIIGGSGNDTINAGGGTDFIVGGAGTDTINGGGGTDYFVYTVGDGHDTVIGGAGTGTQIVNGIATSETFVIGAIDPTHLGISIGTTEANAQLAISDTGVQELVINLGTAGDNVVVNGSLDGTGLATHTITINGGAGDDTVDLSHFTSSQDVVFDGAGNGANGDTAIFGFASTAATYAAVLDSNGNLIGAEITYTAGDGQQVTDTITNVEHFQFTDGTVSVGQLFPPDAHVEHVAVADTAGIDANTIVASGNALNGVTDVDSHTTLQVTAVNGLTADVGSDVVGTYGTLVLDADGSYHYTANAAFDALPANVTAQDAFSFTITDSNGGTTTTDLKFNITGAADTPVVNQVFATVNDTAAQDAGTVVQHGNLLTDGGVDTDRDTGATLTVTSFAGQAVTGGGLDLSTSYGTIHVNTDGSYTFTGNAGLDALGAGVQAGIVDPFAVTSSDGATASSQVQFTINGAADTPVLTNSVFTGSEAEHTAISNVVYQATATDRDNPSNLTYSLTGTDHADFSISSTGAVTFNNSPDYLTQHTFNITVNVSESGLVASENVTINVTPVDTGKAPLSITDTTDAAHTAPVVGDVLQVSLGSDPDGGPIGLVGLQWVENGTVVGTGPTYTVAAGDVGNTITLEASYTDGKGFFDTSTSAATGVVTNSDLPPVNIVPTSGVVAQNSHLVFSSANGNQISVSDPDTTILFETLSVTTGTLTLSGTSGLTFTTGDGTADQTMNFSGTQTAIDTALNGLTYNSGSSTGTDTLIFLSYDGSFAVGSGFNITIGDIPPVNSVPAAQIDVKNSPLTFDAAHGNAISVSDVDTSVLTETLTVLAGTLTLHGTAGLTFTAGDGTTDATMTFSGTQADINAALTGMTYNAGIGTFADTLSITSNDGTHATTDTVGILVQALNHPPLFGAGVLTGEVQGQVGIPAQNFLVNGGFESGATGWTTAATDGFQSIVNGSGSAQSGAEFFQANSFGNSGAVDATLGQTVQTVPGVSYALTFFAASASLTPGADLVVTWNGVVVDTITQSQLSNHAYDQFTVQVTGTGQDALQFAINDPNNNPATFDNWRIDSVSLTPAQHYESTSGSIAFTDADTTDAHTVAVTHTGNNYIGQLEAVVNDATHQVNWTFFASDSDLAAMTSAQETQTYTLTLNDGHGGTATDTVTITLDRPVDSVPVITSGAATGSVTQDGSLGVINLIQDSVFDQPSLFNPTLSPYWTAVGGGHLGGSGPVVDGAINSYNFNPQSTLSQTIHTDVGQVYTIDYWFQGNGTPFTVSENGVQLSSITAITQGWTEESVSFTATSASTTITFGAPGVNGAALSDIQVKTGTHHIVTGTESTSGTFTFTDADHQDTHTATVTGNPTFIWSGGGLTGGQTSLLTATSSLDLGMNDSTGTGSGSVAWNYQISDSAALTFLQPGQTLTEIYTVNVTDSQGGTTPETVTITVNGDSVPVNTVPAEGGVAKNGTLTFSTANGSAVSVSDANNVYLTETLTVSHGALTLHSTTGLTFTVGDGTSDATMTFSGTVADIDAALNGMNYKAPNSNTTDTLVIQSSDGANITTTDVGIVVGVTQSNTLTTSSSDFVVMSSTHNSITGLLGNNGSTVTLQTGDSIYGGTEFDTLILGISSGSNASGTSIGSPFNFNSMTHFSGIDEVAVTGSAAFFLAFGNADITPFQTIIVDAHLNTATSFGATATSVTDGGAFDFIAEHAGHNTLVGGSGNDTFEFTAAGLLANNNSIDGGAGTDTIKITGAMSGSSDSDALWSQIQHVETVVLDIGTNSLTMSTAANGAITSATGSTLTIDDTASTGGNFTLTTDSGLSNSAHLNIIGGSGNDTFMFAGEHFTGADTINGGGGINTIDITDSGGTFTDASFAHISNIQDVAFTQSNGSNSITLGANATADAGSGTLTIDGHASLSLTVDASALGATTSLNVLGGTGNDTFTAGAGDESFTGGTGNDTFKFTAEGAAAIDKILDYNFSTQSDKIDISAILGANANSINAGNIANYVDLKISGSDVVLSVDTGGHGSFGAANEVAVLSGAASNQHIVDVVFASIDHQVNTHA